MAKLLIGSATNYVIRNISDSRIYPIEWYDRAAFPEWDIVTVALTPEEVTAKGEVEVVFEDPPEKSYWLNPDNNTWYEVIVADFNITYVPPGVDPATVESSMFTHPENLEHPVTQAFIDGIGG
jgi:hypothetical protein